MSRDLERNDASRSKAVHHTEPWSQDEIDFLMEFWPKSTDSEAEAEVAECLGRTIEACRQRRYEVMWGRPVVSRKTTTTTTTTEHVYRGHLDDPDDQWWSPDYYRK